MPEVKPPAMGPGRRVVFRPDHKSFGKFILSDQVRDVTEKVAKDIAGRAAELAPRSSGAGPHMADEFKVHREAGVIKVAGNVRVKVDITNSNPAAAPNEFGGKHNKRSRMLGRAGAEFGDFKPDGGLG